MRRSGKVLLNEKLAGTVWQDDDGYGFVYNEQYLSSGKVSPVSFTLPVRKEPYLSKTMIPFFDGLIPEGWLLDITARNWKLDPTDRMELLLVACRDCIGAVSIIRINDEE